jgi:predicted phosphodiesterase
MISTWYAIGRRRRRSQGPLVTFGYGTDLHYADANNYGSPPIDKYLRDGDNKLDDAVTYWNSESLAFVMFGGDFIDGLYRTGAQNLTDLSYIQSRFDLLTHQKYYVFGNHDMDKLTKAQFMSGTGMTEKYYYFDKNGVRFIVLDACYRSDSDSDDFSAGNFSSDALKEFVPPNERAWLTNTLGSAPGKCLIFTHQSLYDETYNMCINNAQAVRSILEASGKVLAVISGHEHIDQEVTVNGIPYYNMRAMTRQAYPANAYAKIEVYADKLVIHGQGNQASYNI